MKKYAYQLYSSREFPPLEKTLNMLADAGYRETEGYGGLFDDPAGTRRKLDQAGLAMTSAHFSLDALANDRDGTEAIAETLGVKSIFAPYLADNDRPADAEGYRRFGRQLQELGDHYKSRGFHFGWHNHAFEFQPLEDGSMPMDHILETAPAIGWEADIAWIVRGGEDPLIWITKHANRISAVHIKDIAPEGSCEDEDGWADVGHGTMDWPGLMAALTKSPVRHFVMEHDKPNDDARFATRSITYIKKLLREP